MAPDDTLKVGNASVDVLGTSMEFLEAPAEKYPFGIRIEFYRPGELVPFRSAQMGPGTALLYMQPDVAQQFKAFARSNGGGG